MNNTTPRPPSSNNPLATTNQREVEDLALRLLSHPRVQRARSTAALLWRSAVAFPARDQMDRFDNMIDEYVFYHALKAANSDGHYPRIVRLMAPAHHWFGRDVPGSRWGGDSPDFIYRMIPIEDGGCYEVHGSITCPEPPLATYALMASNTAAPVTQGLLDSVEMVVAADGTFVITLDSTAPEGRVNHLQAQPGADHLLIRDALGDWLAQSPNSLVVARVNASSRPPLSEDAMAQRAAKTMLETLYYTYYCTRSGFGLGPNEVRKPSSSAAFGGMPTQWSTKGHLWLEDDDALLVRANSAGALFRNVMLTDAFHMSLNYWSRLASLNMNQMAADQDSQFTYVVAHKDPGVHNWLDTNGLRQTMFGHRWQAFPPGYDGEMPTLTAQVVKFADLEKKLPAGARRIDRAGRRIQMARREEGFRRRFIDN